MNQNNQPNFPYQDELQSPAPRTGVLPMGTKVFTVTQTQEDLERLRKTYEQPEAVKTSE